MISLLATTTLLTLLLIIGLPTDVLASGNVGCMFSSSVCDDQTEWCFDDYAFGKCLPHYTDEDVADLFRYDLDKDSLSALVEEMTRLLKGGYGWRSSYTQCVLQELLNSIRFRTEYSRDGCDYFHERFADDVVKDSEPVAEMLLEPESMAHVKFTPSDKNPHAEFADEIYFPLFDDQDDRVLLVPPQGNDLDRLKYTEEELSNKLPQDGPPYGYYDKPKRSRIRLQHDEQDPNYFRQQDEKGIFPLEEFLQSPKIHFTEKYNTPDNFRLGVESKDVSIESPQSKLRKTLLPSFTRNYNTPESFRNGYEVRDDVNNIPVVYIDDRQQDESRFVSPEERQLTWENYKSDDAVLPNNIKQLANLMYNNMENDENADGVDGVYTEGGLIYLKDPENGEEQPDVDELSQLGWGFKRRERLDVKKPGPEFKTNNFAFNKINNEERAGEVKLSVTERSIPEPTIPAILVAEEPQLIEIPNKKKVGSPMESPSHRKPPVTPDENFDSPEYMDGSYAFVVTKDAFKNWQEGAKVVREIAKMLKIDPNTFTRIRCLENWISFKVEPNRPGLNASEVAKKLVTDTIKERLKTTTGVEIVTAGTGQKHKHPAVVKVDDAAGNELWIMLAVLIALGVGAGLVAVFLVFFKRHAKVREKLQNLTRPDTEASKDYQHLCRERMAAKTVQEKPDNTSHVSQRIRESEGHQSPSSRSSTSSWSEEPALTNMDISTGHMVLSYMEDHLKNKDRLEQEWVALCAYEAEPCSTTIATKPENTKKNRYGDVLPYDHARVVLNELANSTGSSYINASTITDHDPRNPAYIATQGPLPHTAADFWQMVWEQGSVVMVMLTRLTENGNAMCHRYWPEEGSELYHIYEVHLVSEHIWCDDYLVRSFYLKNVKTSETRTVTQFHFLSWPENGVPLSTKALLEFRRKVNKSYRGRSCPIIVHCSDGVGRAGTYCLIDMVLNRMAKGAKEIDIAATLEHIRDQRGQMVRTKQQFEFVLMAVAEEVHAILKALPANHSPPPVLKEKE